MSEQQLIRADAALLVVDFQENLAKAMAPEELARASRNTGVLLTAARRLRLPVLATEQYPRGLGSTIAELRPLLADVEIVEKLEFSCARAPGFDDQLAGIAPRNSIIVTGMEAHVCVYQTVLDLLERGVSVQVPRDAVVSRTAQNLETGLRLMERAGAVVTSTETVLFQLLERAGTDEFRELSKLIR
jgi:nicotinamidase-related amidase